MQNTSQTFRGAGAPGVNFSEHTYDNHIGAHCQPAGYQPYTNPPYHPIPSPRPHHYANHQMQQNMPYRHHGGAYAPNQNQYGQNMNQEMYRNHHSGYVGSPNPRNMPNKSWSENNASPDIMSPYGQVSHPQMMNNSPQMPVNSMRSPPHATSNMNPTPPQSQQHYRQMQSPAHSPHSWSQAQIPSPGVMHSSRTTPSPLPAHVRSPGHSQQPFSPPAAHAMNMPPHPQPPENGQIPPTMNPTGGSDNHNPSNPLHSLQKMVMLEQDPSKVMLPLIGDGSEQFTNQCGSHNFVPDEGASNESKDSAYSTYYNMDENRFESKPATNDNSAYSSVQQVSNCNFPLPSHPLSNEEVKSPSVVPTSNSSNLHDMLHSDPITTAPNNLVSAIPLAQCTSNISQNNCSLNLADCPPHAESAPVFTDQTKAAVSTNSEQALESKSIPDVSSKISSDNETPLANIPNPNVAGEHSSSDETAVSGETVVLDETAVPDKISQVTECVQIKSEGKDQLDNACKMQLTPNESDSLPMSEKIPCETLQSSSNNPDSCTPLNSVQCKEELPDLLENTAGKTFCPTTIKLIAEVHKSDIDDDVEVLESLKEENCQDNDSKKSTLRRRKVGASYEEAPSPEIDLKESCPVESPSSKPMSNDSKSDTKLLPPTKCDNASSNQDFYDSKPIKDMARNPVKVVIHRIRKDDTNDTWHVPGNNNEANHATNVNEGICEKKAESKIPNVGPQIIILSPASPQKKFGFQSSVASNNVITVSEDNAIVDVESEATESKFSSKKRNSSGCLSPDKKRGRPVGSKNKMKPGCVKKKRGKKGSRKKILELSKVPESPAKPKRVKIFSGPYVHIVGSKDNPSSIKVVNVAQKEEEKINKIQTKRNFSNTVNRIKKKPVGHLSTLSPTYDAFNRDKTWLCVFCQKGSHIGGLGDLYGPYYIKDKNPENTKSSVSTPSTSSVSGSSRGKRRKSEADEGKGSKRTKHSTSHSPIESTPRNSSQIDASLDPDTADMREVWIHEDCAVWCQSISLLGEEVQGLEEAVAEANENTCCQCSMHGATLGCWGKSCKEQYHFSCAKDTGCQMDIENFSLLCPKHQKKSPDRRNRCQ